MQQTRKYLAPVPAVLVVVAIWIVVAVYGPGPRGYGRIVIGSVVIIAASAVAMKRRGW